MHTKMIENRVQVPYIIVFYMYREMLSGCFEYGKDIAFFFLTTKTLSFLHGSG